MKKFRVQIEVNGVTVNAVIAAETYEDAKAKLMKQLNPEKT